MFFFERPSELYENIVHIKEIFSKNDKLTISEGAAKFKISNGSINDST